MMNHPFADLIWLKMVPNIIIRPRDPFLLMLSIKFPLILNTLFFSAR